jgi:hypothetical protein
MPKLRIRDRWNRTLTRKEKNVERDWVIRKVGYFYRANRSGYTQEISAAGRYTEAEAKAEARIEPWRMSAHLASEFQACMCPHCGK